MPLIEQTVTVKVISDKVMLRYDNEYGESMSFILNNLNTFNLASMLERASKSKGKYECTINI